jgi:tRNA pseudouridine32 synthase / 23S rRNA pseudouridine746 synthase
MEPLTLVFRNDHFVAIEKPPLWLSVPSRDAKKEHRPIAGLVLQEQLQTKIFPCHRLDEPVSGLLLFALHAKSHSVANKWFEKSEIQKTYESYSCAVENPSLHVPDIGTEVSWECLLAKGKKRAYEHPSIGKKSLTLARVVSHNALPQLSSVPIWKWHLKPLTGRSHQLRFEMSRHGCPILGDSLYGSASPWPYPGIALRLWELDFRNCPEKDQYQLPDFLQSRLLFP